MHGHRACLAAIAALASAWVSPVQAAGAPRDRDLGEIRRAAAERIESGRQAWLQRRPELLVGPGPDSLVLARTPDGAAITRGQLLADLRRRMAMVARIDTILEVVDSVRVESDSAVVMTSQRFVRWIRQPEGRERKRISSVTHRQVFRRERGRWRTAGPIQEIEPRAHWADEGPAGP